MTGAEPSPSLIPAGTARAADADREAVAERLRIAAGEGRIDLAELDERLGRAYGAKTYGQLRAIVSDLPDHPAALAQQDAPPEPEALVLKTTAANIRQSGEWTVPRRIVAESTSGFITIDFTRASCAHRNVDVQVVTRAGWVRLILPHGWAARIGAASTNTSHIRNKAGHEPGPGAPVITVTGQPATGYIRIRHPRRK
ncbi:MAG TPA: DUF1707 domain-containing protein [Streptosporangiaceae bacterium]|jgi:hypothetical protein